MKRRTLLTLPALSALLASASVMAQPSARPNTPKPGVPHAITDITQPTISPVAAAMIPDGGFWFAGLTSYNSGDGDAEMYIYQISKTGVKAVFSEPHNRSWASGWQDPHTFVVTDIADKTGAIVVRTFRDGVLSKTQSVPASAWQLTADIKPPDMPDLRFTRDALWLESCVAFKTNDPERCSKTAAVKIAGDGITSAKAAPAKARRGAMRVTPPTVKAAATPTVKLRTVEINGTKVRGLACTDKASNNGATVTWPTSATINWEFAPRPKKITWHSVVPPVYSVTGPATNPIAQTSTSTRTFRGCAAEPMDDFRWITKGVWAEAVVHSFADGPVSHTTWHIFAAAEPIAVLLASDASFFPAPL